MLKILILVLFVAMLFSLFFGGHFLVNDASPSRRVLASLTLRVVLAVALVCTITFGFLSGQLS